MTKTLWELLRKSGIMSWTIPNSLEQHLLGETPPCGQQWCYYTAALTVTRKMPVSETKNTKTSRTLPELQPLCSLLTKNSRSHPRHVHRRLYSFTAVFIPSPSSLFLHRRLYSFTYRSPAHWGFIFAPHSRGGAALAPSTFSVHTTISVC